MIGVNAFDNIKTAIGNLGNAFEAGFIVALGKVQTTVAGLKFALLKFVEDSLFAIAGLANFLSKDTADAIKQFANAVRKETKSARADFDKTKKSVAELEKSLDVIGEIKPFVELTKGTISLQEELERIGTQEVEDVAKAAGDATTAFKGTEDQVKAILEHLQEQGTL